MEFLLIFVRTIMCYTVLVVSLRIMGKREIGQFSLFDLIILLSIADIMVVGIEKYEQKFIYVLFPVILLTLLQKLVAFIMLKIPKTRKLMDGKPTIIVLNGKLLKEEMNKQSYNIEDLLLQLRTQGIFTLDDVFFAVLETNGKLSVIKKKDKSKIFPLPVIVSGEVDENVLKYSGKNMEWISKNLGKNHLVKEEILCAFINEDDLMIVD